MQFLSHSTTLFHGLCGSNKLLYKRCALSTGRPKFRPPPSQLPHCIGQNIKSRKRPSDRPSGVCGQDCGVI